MRLSPACRILAELKSAVVSYLPTKDLVSMSTVSWNWRETVKTDARFAINAVFDPFNDNVAYEQQMIKMLHRLEYAQQYGFWIRVDFHALRPSSTAPPRAEWLRQVEFFLRCLILGLRRAISRVVSLEVALLSELWDTFTAVIEDRAPVLRALRLSLPERQQPIAASSIAIPIQIFSGGAPLLQSVDLAFFPIGSTRIPVFSRVTEVKLSISNITFAHGSPARISDVFPRATNLDLDLIEAGICTPHVWGRLDITTGLSLKSLKCTFFANGIFKRVIAATPEDFLTIKTIVFDSVDPDELDTLFATCGQSTAPTLALRIAQYFIYPEVNETQFMLRDTQSDHTRVFTTECDYTEDGADLQKLSRCAFATSITKRLVHLAIEVDFIPHMLYAEGPQFPLFFIRLGKMPQLKTLEVHLRKNWTVWPVSAMALPGERLRARPSSTDRRMAAPKLEIVRLCAIGETRKVSKSMVTRLTAALQLGNEDRKGKVTLELHSTKGVSVKGLDSFAKVVRIDRLIAPDELFNRYGRGSREDD